MPARSVVNRSCTAAYQEESVFSKSIPWGLLDTCSAAHDDGYRGACGQLWTVSLRGAVSCLLRLEVQAPSPSSLGTLLGPAMGIGSVTELRATWQP